MDRQVVNPWKWQETFGFHQAVLVAGAERVAQEIRELVRHLLSGAPTQVRRAIHVGPRGHRTDETGHEEQKLGACPATLGGLAHDVPPSSEASCETPRRIVSGGAEVKQIRTCSG